MADELGAVFDTLDSVAATLADDATAYLVARRRRDDLICQAAALGAAHRAIAAHAGVSSVMVRKIVHREAAR